MNLNYLDFNTWIKLYHSIDEVRLKILFGILYSTGCSEKELVKIKVSDLFLKKRQIKFSERESSINLELVKIISDYIISKKLKKKDFLLRTRQSSSISEKRIQQLVLETSQKKIKQKILPKTIRYTHIAHALLKKISISSIGLQTGLKSQRLLQIASALKLEIKDSYRYEL